MEQASASAQRRPTQDELRANTREFGNEANRVDSVSDRVAAAIERLNASLDRIDHIAANGNQPHSHLAPRAGGEQTWPYAGIDTARDHKLLGGSIGGLEGGMLQLETVMLRFEPAILRLETRFEFRFSQLMARMDDVLARIQQAA